jgi:hypothetical protein
VPETKKQELTKGEEKWQDLSNENVTRAIKKTTEKMMNKVDNKNNNFLFKSQCSVVLCCKIWTNIIESKSQTYRRRYYGKWPQRHGKELEWRLTDHWQSVEQLMIGKRSMKCQRIRLETNKWMMREEKNAIWNVRDKLYWAFAVQKNWCAVKRREVSVLILSKHWMKFSKRTGWNDGRQNGENHRCGKVGWSKHIK